MMSELEALGARIASCRGTRSQKDLALETGLDVSTISRIERGITDPTYGTLGKIRKALNVPWDALVLDAADTRVTGDHPGKDFLDRRMLPSQASRLAALVKYEVDACGLESFDANAREFADAMGNVAWADTISALALAKSRWVPKATVLDRIATCIGMEHALALPLLRLETERGSLDAVLTAWENEMARRRALRGTKPSLVPPKEKVPATGAKIRVLRTAFQGHRSTTEVVREQARLEFARLNERLDETIRIMSEHLPPAKAKELTKKLRGRAS
jgi:transcriptional regulator with XRE-family HTH domain